MVFVPATDDAVRISREMVSAAERTRKAECGNGDPGQRGKNCRQRETEEAAARTALTAAVASKVATDRAAKLDADIRALRKRLDGGEAVTNPNPLGTALELMLGAGAASPRKSRGRAPKPINGGSAKGFVREHLFPADDSERRHQVPDAHPSSLVRREGVPPAELNAFLDEIEGLCRKLGNRIEVGEDQRVYCLGVKIDAPSPASIH